MSIGICNNSLWTDSYVKLVGLVWNHHKLGAKTHYKSQNGFDGGSTEMLLCSHYYAYCDFLTIGGGGQRYTRKASVAVAITVIHHHRIASVGRRVARPWWPRPRACLQRSAGVWLVSFRIWSIHLPRGRPGRRLQDRWGRRPSEVRWLDLVG